jgi:hypothetical protein
MESDRAIIQTLNHRLPTSAAWIQSQFNSCRICGGQNDTEAGYFIIFLMG